MQLRWQRLHALHDALDALDAAALAALDDAGKVTLSPDENFDALRRLYDAPTFRTPTRVLNVQTGQLEPA
jgi:hypothetical protein